MPIAKLSPAEAYVLLNPGESSSAEAFKIAFLSLVAARVLKIGTVERRKLFGHKTISTASVIGAMPTDPLAAEIIATVRGADPAATGAEFPAIAKKALKSFGPGLSRIKSFIVPSLKERGLMTTKVRRWLIFKRTDYYLTQEGEAEKQRIQDTLELARRLPELLDADPAEAQTIVLAAGPLLLLLPELKSHYRKLAALNAPSVFDGDSSGDVYFEGTSHHGSDDHSHPGGIDIGSLDFSSFDVGALDMDFGSFDASFDSSMSDSSGDSGSDGGSHH